MTSKGVSALLNILKKYDSVVSMLDLSWNPLKDEFIKSLGEYLQDNENLERLVLTGDQITDNAICILSDCIAGNTRLKELSLDWNRGITDASIPYILEIAKRSSVTKLDTLYTSIADEKRQEVDNAIKLPNEQREIPIKSNAKSAAKIFWEVPSREKKKETGMKKEKYESKWQK